MNESRVIYFVSLRDRSNKASTERETRKRKADLERYKFQGWMRFIAVENRAEYSIYTDSDVSQD